MAKTNVPTQIGFEIREPIPAKKSLSGSAELPQISVSATVSPVYKPGESLVSFFRLSEIEYLDPEQRSNEAPQWFKDAQPLTEADQVINNIAPPIPLPLIRRARLWPFLHTALGARSETGNVDINRLIRVFTEGRFLKRLPRKRRKRWASSCQVIIDYSLALLPFWRDFNQLTAIVHQLRGDSGAEILLMEQGPDKQCRRYWQGKEQWQHW